MNEQATQAVEDETPAMETTEETTAEAAPAVEEAPAEASAEEAPAPAVEDSVETADIAQVMDAPAEKDEKQATTRNRGMRWYIIHAYTGFEQKVAKAILEEAEQKGIRDLFEDVVVPSEEVVEVRRGKKVQTERKLFPGYVLAKMQMTDATWQLVRTTDKVAGFLGGRGQRPQPITEAEANAIFAQVQEGIDAPKRAVNYDIGEQVKVIDGPFDSFIGVVEDIDDMKEKLKVSVSIFGRPTPVELDFGQVEKV